MSIENINIFEEIIRKKLFDLSKDYLSTDPDFQDYMSDLRLAMSSIDENVISHAIVVFIRLHEREEQK